MLQGIICTIMMHQIRHVFFLERIYHKQTWWDIFSSYALILLLSFFTFDTTSRKVLGGIVGITVLFFFIRTCIRTIVVDKRLKEAAATNLHVRSSDVYRSAIDYGLDGIDETIPLASGDGWKLYDTIFNFYKKTKHGEYLARQAYHTVYEADLIRSVPNILFDGKSAKRSQYKNLVLQSQRISLEGNFNKFFDTYVPHTYHVDSLSFITPEVMLALIEAKNFDIELNGDKVFIYGPLIDLAHCDDMVNLCHNITEHINDNLKTYRDTRLSKKEGKKHVSFFANSLLKSPMRHVPLLVLSGLGTVGIIYFSFTGMSEYLFNAYSLIIFATFITKTWEVGKIVSTNRSLTRKFLAAQRYSSVNPHRTV